jgi:hypothetical protein
MPGFRLRVYDATGNCLFHGILNSYVQVDDSRIDRDGIIYTRTVITWENIIKQIINPKREFTVRICVI